MKDHEIFDHWWEVFKVARWGLSPPVDTVLLGRSRPTRETINEQYHERVKLLYNAKQDQRIKKFEDSVDQAFKAEEDRKATIEGKAHSLVGQTGITVSLLLAALSIGVNQLSYWPLAIRITAWLLFFFAAVQFVISGLQARNAVVLGRGYAQSFLDDWLEIGSNDIDLAISKILAVEHNSFLNDAKATYLKFAHWYFKFGIGSLLVTFVGIAAMTFAYAPEKQVQADGGSPGTNTCQTTRTSLAEPTNHVDSVRGEERMPQTKSKDSAKVN